MDRCHLKGELGDRLHAVLCAAGYNIRWLLRAIAREGLKAFTRLLPVHVAAAILRLLKDSQSQVAAQFGFRPPCGA